MKDAALAAFVSPNKEDWRFSLVKMDYKFEKIKTGRLKVKEEFTPARRWSFLVGANEKSHTAQIQMKKILADDEHDPTLAELEQAFDIEIVTKEFFLKYRDLFLRTKEELDKVFKNNQKVKADFKAKGVDTVNFAKKMLGQIVFLYFLQKKGWFGVGRDDDWGTGSKNFLRELYDKEHGYYKNFFNDILEPLFYEALRRDRSDNDGYYSRFNCKIPFLNGGLFDPIGNYDWVRSDINLPDKLFSNTNKTKEGDTGDGILDIFDRYNFTVKEDEPLEKEVAIDPELLGKAYEKFNAIRPDNYDEFRKALKSGKTGEENRFNKKFGVYYTPREIVHYMCQQSLLNYLYSEINKGSVSYENLGDPQLNIFGNKNKKGQLDLAIEHKQFQVISKEDIETLVHTGEQVIENEETALIKEQNIKEEKQKTSEYKLKLPDTIRNNAALIDQKLADITACDPAVGSGAFPVGMMSEIVKIRNVLTTFIKDKYRTIYDFKRRCIEYSLYGVDIDPGAVEIAKLRLWLSLIVDEEDIENVKPLPNLDYRIMQGNSLISEFMGINFDAENEKNIENLMFKDETDELTEHFQQKKNEFLNESNVTRKSKLKEEIEGLLVKIFETKLKTQRAVYFNRLKEIEIKHSTWPTKKQRDEFIKQDKEKLYKEFGFDLESTEKQLKEFTSGKKIKSFFLWNFYFSEVFHNKGGFDVVIANPPYISHDKIPIDKHFLKKNYQCYEPFADIYCYFVEKAISLQNKKGVLSFITSNSYLRAEYGSPIRKLLRKENELLNIVNLEHTQMFQEVIVNVAILVSTKSFTSRKCFVFSQPYSDNIFNFADYITAKSIMYDQLKFDSKSWSLIDPVKVSIQQKMEKLGKTIEQLGSKIRLGLATGHNKAFIIDEDKRKDIIKKNRKNAEIIKPILRGRDIFRYYYAYPNSYILLTKNGINVQKEYPDIYKYLDGFGKAFKKRGAQGHHWTNLRAAAFFDDFKEAKIVWIELTDVGRFALCTDEIYLLNSAYFLLPPPKINIKYLLGILNSKLIYFYLGTIAETSGMGVSRWINNYVKEFPIIEVADDRQKEVIRPVDRILAAKRANPEADTTAWEREIDQLVYKLYGLTEAEIKIVESSS